MKQHLLPEQTAKLIELGFEKPSPKWVKDEMAIIELRQTMLTTI